MHRLFLYAFLTVSLFSCGTDTSTSQLGEDEATEVKSEKLSSDATTSEPTKESVLITGFGPFKDIETNPTGTLVQDPEFQKSMIEKYPQYDFTFDTLDVKKSEFETRYADRKFDKVINLGVDRRATAIRIEPGATNWTNFHGTECPSGVCVQGTENGRSQIFQSNIVPPQTFFQNNPMAGNYPIQMGTNTSTGTYVCNSTYCNSLNMNNNNALFVHTPLPSDTEQYRTNMTSFFDQLFSQY